MCTVSAVSCASDCMYHNSRNECRGCGFSFPPFPFGLSDIAYCGIHKGERESRQEEGVGRNERGGGGVINHIETAHRAGGRGRGRGRLFILPIPFQCGLLPTTSRNEMRIQGKPLYCMYLRRFEKYKALRTHSLAWLGCFASLKNKLFPYYRVFITTRTDNVLKFY